MTGYSPFEIWTIIIVLGIGTFALRYVFLGLAARKPMPEWLLRYLRYTPVAVLPGMVAPLVLWPEATGGMPEPARMLAALLTLGAGIVTRNVLLAILAGFISLYLGLFLIF
ncbi:AzlD domain-containing protein [Thioclava sp. GXIMD4216]|uniref:AzlD domain-containing protein n=1 Tax=Thioclava litoralis TaxID=3076557 RepID=A0ABZ1DXT5_9RHOB|nr:AzlD domain-containing protein [Thioclava sp. FTW29]